MKTPERKIYSSDKIKAYRDQDRSIVANQEFHKKAAIIENCLPYNELIPLCGNRLGALNFITEYYEAKGIEEIEHPEKGSLYTAYWFKQFDDSESVGKTILMMPLMMFGVAGSSTKLFSFATTHRFHKSELTGFFFCRTFTEFFQRMFGLAMLLAIAAIVIIVMYAFISREFTFDMGLYLLSFTAATAILRFLSSPRFSFGYPEELKKVSRGYFYLADFKKVPGEPQT